jgi:cell division protein FtsN
MARHVAVGAFSTRTEAELVRGLLASAGIDAWVAADDAGGAYPAGMFGAARVMVADVDREEAERVLAAPQEPPPL